MGAGARKAAARRNIVSVSELEQSAVKNVIALVARTAMKANFSCKRKINGLEFQRGLSKTQLSESLSRTLDRMSETQTIVL